jgi:hypothetical protein
MKRFTHAWLSSMAIKRFNESKIEDEERRYADNLVGWFMNHKDGVIQGAWYPDAVTKDMGTGHVLKITPAGDTEKKFRSLPSTHLSYKHGKECSLMDKEFKIEKKNNLPDRCESIAHSVIDHLKMQECEDKGSPVSPTDNQIALLLFMLSHYVADAHVPFHCDGRKFSEGANLHGHIEGIWEDMIERYYEIDKGNERFYYDPHGHPLRKVKDKNIEVEYQSSILKKVQDLLGKRDFVVSYGSKNNNVWDFISAVCQYSYLLSYRLLPKQFDHTNITLENWRSCCDMAFDEYSVAVLCDAVDSISRVWFRIWRRYMNWLDEKMAKESGTGVKTVIS